MISDETIQGNIALFKGLEAHLTQLVGKYKSLEEDAGKQPNEILRKWYNLCNENYAISRRRVSDYLSGQTISENDLNDFQYMRQVGTVLMPIILNFVNSYEYISTLLRLNSKSLSDQLDAIIKPQLDSLDSKWSETDKSIRNSIIQVIKDSVRNTSKVRKALRKMDVIDDNDAKLLSFVWDIRNAMHNNFVNTGKISYELKDKDTGRTLKYHLEAGAGIQFWDTPKWNIVITEELAEIMVKIIGGLNDLPMEKSKLQDL